jgi:aldehyde:ferredoxin oxidoreductase
MGQNYGYAGKIIRVNLTAGSIETIPTDQYADQYLGGRGIALKIHWDEVPPEKDALDPENRLIFMTGPVAGVPGLAGSRWQVSGKSPLHDQWCYCNLGGNWGARLKFAGYDGIIVHGRSDKLMYLFIEDGKIELRDAAGFKGKGAIPTRKELKAELDSSFSVVAVGAAGENGVRYATLTADQDASGSGGLGAVMGTKNLKAVAVKGTGKVAVADKEKVSALRRHIKDIKNPPSIWPTMLPQERIKKIMCFGCIKGCMRAEYTAKDGQVGKYICQSAMYYEIRGQRYYNDITDVSFVANKLCDDYGVDTRAIEALIMWLVRCYKSGILTEENTGLPLSKIGSQEYIETLLHKISFREGFGDVLAEGTIKAAEKVGQNSAKFIGDYMAQTGEIHVYGARMYLSTGLLYAFDPRLPIQQLHEISMQALTWAARETGAGANADGDSPYNYMTSDVIRRIAKRFWGDEICADYSTYEGKAQAAVRIQERQFAKECLILCDFSYPIIHSASIEGHVGDPALDSQICAAITGRDIDEQGLYKIAERGFNLQRAILTREGRKGRDFDKIEEFNFSTPLKGDFGNPECLVPGKDGKPYSRKGMVVDREKFEEMKDEFYKLRGWDVKTGYQTRAKLQELGLDDVADTLQSQGLLA